MYPVEVTGVVTSPMGNVCVPHVCSGYSEEGRGKRRP